MGGDWSGFPLSALTSDAIRPLQKAGGLQPRACRYVRRSEAHVFFARVALSVRSMHIQGVTYEHSVAEAGSVLGRSG